MVTSSELLRDHTTITPARIFLIYGWCLFEIKRKNYPNVDVPRFAKALRAVLVFVSERAVL